jgi:glycosyltransferase involved in cell wall biosynthesis
MRKITVLVSNDLSHDQRVRKTCDSLIKLGFAPTLVGRKLTTSIDFSRPYPVKRFKLPFNHGGLFYATLNIRVFFFLLFASTDFIWANDLDTLPAAWLVSRLRGKKLIYDSHEYFTEAAGLDGRRFQKRVWEWFEWLILPDLNAIFTVNEKIASIYEEQYHCHVAVLRNVPEFNPLINVKSRAELNLPEGPLFILQGAFMDKDRGAIDAVKAMKFIDSGTLLLIGAGEEFDQAAVLRKELGLESRIIMLPKQTYNELRHYTANADIGLSLDKGYYFNYLYSLPNKLFDYVHAGIPVLASDLPIVGKVVRDYEFGEVMENYTPENIAAGINSIIAKGKGAYAAGISKVQTEFHWHKESDVIRKVFVREGWLK